MVYRGVYRDGVVIVPGGLDLPEGAEVEVLPAARGGNSRRPAAKPKGKKPAAAKKTLAKKSKVAKRPKRMSKAERLAALEAARGMWKNRPDFRGRSTEEIAHEWRLKFSRTGGR